MSIGIFISVHDGIVLAADSASTLTVMTGPTADQPLQPNSVPNGPIALNVYNNANKIANLYNRELQSCGVTHTALLSALK